MGIVNTVIDDDVHKIEDENEPDPESESDLINNNDNMYIDDDEPIKLSDIMSSLSLMMFITICYNIITLICFIIIILKLY